ncbi:MAG: hypothetical protein ABGW74_04165, partial [Campylobacterales bacterium]
MSDSIKELADLNTNARELLKKHSETLKSVKVIADEAKESVKVIADEAKESIKAFDYMEVGKPQINTNPTKKNTTWLNLQDGGIWVCTDNTVDENIWVSGADVVKKDGFNTVDIFEDGSCISYFSMKNTIQDLASSLTLVKNDCILKNDCIESQKWASKGLIFNNIAKIDLKKYKNFTITILHKHKRRA